MKAKGESVLRPGPGPLLSCKPEIMHAVNTCCWNGKLLFCVLLFFIAIIYSIKLYLEPTFATHGRWSRPLPLRGVVTVGACLLFPIVFNTILHERSIGPRRILLTPQGQDQANEGKGRGQTHLAPGPLHTRPRSSKRRYFSTHCLCNYIQIVLGNPVIIQYL